MPAALPLVLPASFPTPCPNESCQLAGIELVCKLPVNFQKKDTSLLSAHNTPQLSSPAQLTCHSLCALLVCLPLCLFLYLHLPKMNADGGFTGKDRCVTTAAAKAINADNVYPHTHARTPVPSTHTHNPIPRWQTPSLIEDSQLNPAALRAEMKWNIKLTRNVFPLHFFCWPFIAFTQSIEGYYKFVPAQNICDRR